MSDVYKPPLGLQIYDWFLIIGTAYLALSTDISNGWLAGLAFGNRTDPEKDIWNKYLYEIFSKNDPTMRAYPKPLYGRKDALPPFLGVQGYTNATLAAIFEILIIIGLLNGIFKKPKGGDIPKWLQFVSAAFIFRGLFEILYAMHLHFNNVEPLRGTASLSYWIVALPQIYTPFLVAERFYEGTYEYKFNGGRLAIFLLIPTGLIFFGLFLYGYVKGNPKSC